MTKLMPFQKEDVDRILQELDGRVLLANEMGTGKTLEALTCLKSLKQWPVVIVCPAGLKLHWQREAMQHYKMETTILSGSVARGTKTLKSAKIFIINYDILHGWLGFLRGLSPQVVIGDEIHYCQSMKTRRTRAFAILCRGVEHVLALSGTPLTNRPWELFPVLNILWPQEFHSPFSFGHAYCNATQVFGHWKFDGAKNLGKLHVRLKKLGMIRRTKKEVLGQLPPIRRIVLPVEIENRKEYDEAEEDFLIWLAKLDPIAAGKAALDARTRLGYLKRLAARLKMRVVKDWITNFLEESDGKLLVGLIHRTIIDNLCTTFGSVGVVIHGGKTTRQRQRAEDQFRTNPDTRILLGQIQACGVGLNLPEASTVMLAEFPWTPGAVQQFIARVHRMTSTEPVSAYFLAAHGTIEEHLLKIIERKNRTLDRVLDGVARQESSLTVFEELQKALQEKEVP